MSQRVSHHLGEFNNAGATGLHTPAAKPGSTSTVSPALHPKRKFTTITFFNMQILPTIIPLHLR